MDNIENNNNKRNFRAFALATSVYGGASILGPLLFLGGGGYFLDKMFQTGRLFFVGGIFLAFIITNVLLYRRAAEISKEIVKLSPPPIKEEEEDEDL
jgi:F0F1-type ATP synthase assembly protein I